MATCELIGWCPIANLAIATCHRVAAGPSPCAYGGMLKAGERDKRDLPSWTEPSPGANACAWIEAGQKSERDCPEVHEGLR